MKILVTEARQGDGRMIGALLAIEGHDVSFCHSPGGQAGPCVGMTQGGECPLLTKAIDTVVDVRLEGGPLTSLEFGALCAAQSGTLLVVAGPIPARSPLAELAAVACPPGNITDVCAGIDSTRAASRR